jgi:hypothetical protein
MVWPGRDGDAAYIAADRQRWLNRVNLRVSNKTNLMFPTPLCFLSFLLSFKVQTLWVVIIMDIAVHGWRASVRT